MSRWVRLFAPVFAAGYAAIGRSAANAQAQVVPATATAAPQDENSTNEAADTEQQDDIEATDNDAAEAALAGKANITVEQATATVLAANPGATVTKTELDGEDGTVIYSVELNNGDDVKVDAQSGAIIRTDKEGSEDPQDGETNDDADQEETAQ